MKENKKAQTPTDLFIIFGMIVFISIGCLVSFHIYNSFYAQIQITPIVNESSATMAAFDSGNKVNDMLDYVILILIIGMMLVMLIIGYFIDTHSIFLPIYIIGLLVAVIFAIILQGVWDGFAHSATFNTIATINMPITNSIMNNLAIWMTIIGCLSMIVTFAKNREGVSY